MVTIINILTRQKINIEDVVNEYGQVVKTAEEKAEAYIGVKNPIWIKEGEPLPVGEQFAREVIEASLKESQERENALDQREKAVAEMEEKARQMMEQAQKINK